MSPELGAKLIKLLEALPFRWDGDKQTIALDKRDLIEQVKGIING